MKVEALNCPNCGAAVSSDAAQCLFCNSRLKTCACPECFGTMFLGSRHCPRCGAKAVQPEIRSTENSGDCPRCGIKLNLLEIGEILLRECESCQGLWADVETFEDLCADSESQAAVLSFAANKHYENKNLKVNYVPCPDCKQLMNRNNFARSSGVIIDVCKKHGVWFDAEELPNIVEFIHQGGLSRAREKEKIQLEEQRKSLREQQRQISLDNTDFNEPVNGWEFDSSLAVREFVRFLFD